MGGIELNRLDYTKIRYTVTTTFWIVIDKEACLLDFEALCPLQPHIPTSFCNV